MYLNTFNYEILIKCFNFLQLIEVSFKPRKLVRKFSLYNECYKISNYQQTGKVCTADVKIAYTLQLIIIKLQTKYKIILFHRSQKNVT